MAVSGLHGMICAFGREIQCADWLCKETPFDLLKHLAVWQLQVSNKKSKGGPNGGRKELSAHPLEL